MLAKRALLIVSCLLIILFPLKIPTANACGHDGVYLGLGYTQLFMYTPEDRLSDGNLGRIKFGPGYGANALVGYDFCGSRWGIQAPFEFARLKLNNYEWVNSFGSSVEAVFHIIEWQNGIDFHLVGGVGWTFLTEGRAQDRSESAGITASLGPGFSYYFYRSDTTVGGLALEVPFRVINYFGDRLSENGTTVVAFPIRLTLEIGF